LLSDPYFLHIFEDSFKGFARKIRVCELDPMQEASVVEWFRHGFQIQY